MMASTAVGFSSHRPTPGSTMIDPKPNPINPISLPYSQANRAASEPPKFKGSPQLNRWSRARAIRSGRKLERQGQRPQVVEMNPRVPAKESVSSPSTPSAEAPGNDDREVATGKSIFMVSDGTGWTVEHSVGAALGQFEHCLVDRGCSVNTHLFSGVNLFFPY